jgi:hypothetical protein
MNDKPNNGAKQSRLIPFVVDCMDAGGRAPTVGALGDAGAVAEKYA